MLWFKVAVGFYPARSILVSMHVLGIECSAHTFSASVVDASGRFLSNEKASFTSDGPGMVPRQVLRFHQANRDSVLQKALEPVGPDAAGRIDAVAVSQGPGIGTLLHEGLEFAKPLAEQWGVPLLGVNHAVAHLEIGRKECGAKDPIFLYVSGGNTQLLVRQSSEEKSKADKYAVVGETLDIGLGNLLDKSARLLGMGFPGGPLLYELSLKGNRFVELPYSVKGMDVCFSGLYTAFKNKMEGDKGKRVEAERKPVVKGKNGGVGEEKKKQMAEGKSEDRVHPLPHSPDLPHSFASFSHFTPADLAFSLQEVAFDMVCETAERALAHFEKDELVLAGGVACSKILQNKTKVMCEERGARMLVPENKFLTDNAAMIAWNGLLALKAGQTPLGHDAAARPQWRPEDVEVLWS